MKLLRLLVSIHTLGSTLLLLGGCANMFISGGSVVNKDYSKESVASYRLDKCIDRTTNAPAQTVDITIHIVKQADETLVFERSSDGTGSLFKNHWTASDGIHYFAWVGAADVGYEYIFPQAGSLRPRRLVYDGLQKTKHRDGSVRPSSDAGSQCELVSMTKSSVTF